MIQKESVHSAIALAELYAEKHLVVAAKPSTLMSELVSRTNYDVLADSEDDKDYSVFANNIEIMSTGDINTPSLHDQYIDQAIEGISNAVKAHISFAKNIVKPIVIDVAEGTTAYLREFRYPQAADKFCVCVVDVPELLEDEDFVSTLEIYKNKSPIKPDVMPSLGEKTQEELLGLLLTGDKEADEALTIWYTRLGTGFFSNVWENLFRDNQPNRAINTLVTYDDILGYDIFERADYALAVYMMARKLFDELDPSATNVNLVGYQNIIAQTRDFAGCVLYNVIERARSFESTKIMVINTDARNQSVKVYGKVYRPWLQNGGCSEAMLGLIVSGRSLTTMYSVDELKQQLLDTWKTHSAFFMAAENNKRFDYFKDALKIKFNEVMNDLSDIEKEYIEQRPNYLQDVQTQLDAELDKLTPQDADDVYMAALKVVCRSRFGYTQAESILGDIVEASLLNKDVDVREAALIATANYVVDFIVDQLTLVKV